MLYEFKCLECGGVFQKIMRVDDKEKAERLICPYCDKEVPVMALIGNCNFSRFWNRL